MKIKKIIVFVFVFTLVMVTGCEKNETVVYNSNIIVKGLTLKTSIIQTAYEMYNVNVKSPDSFNEDLYKEASKDALRHYKWLRNTYATLDESMKTSLDNIFYSLDQWDYLNEVITLDDNANIIEIINTINNSSDLDLSSSEKESINYFFDSFYDEYYKSYFNKVKKKYDRDATNLNTKFVDSNIDIIKFMEDTSGIEFTENYKSIFYYSLNPFQSQVFKDNNTIVSTIQRGTNAQDILSICFYQYSKYLFDSFAESNEFIKICEILKSDSSFVDEYNKSSKNAYDFNSWCKENLVAGFSKYLDYRYCQSDYQFSSYTYDLDFYNYLRKISFNPNKMDLKNVSIAFYNDKVNTILASSNN